MKVSQFGAEFVKNFRDFMGGDPEVPHLTLQSFGYMYLADTPEFAEHLKRNQQVQMSLGAATRHMTRDEIAAAYPFYQLDDIIAGNHNLIDEGYFDGGTMFDWFKRMARRNGVEYVHDEVVAMTKGPDGQDRQCYAENRHQGRLRQGGQRVGPPCDGDGADGRRYPPGRAAQALYLRV